MHELVTTKRIFQIVLKHTQNGHVNRVLTVNLEIGALSDLQKDWIQRYFDHLSRGTIVEGAKLNITRVPAVFQCNECHQTFEIKSLLEEDLSCRECCSNEISLISGNEYRVKNMEVQ